MSIQSSVSIIVPTSNTSTMDFSHSQSQLVLSLNHVLGTEGSLLFPQEKVIKRRIQLNHVKSPFFKTLNKKTI